MTVKTDPPGPKADLSRLRRVTKRTAELDDERLALMRRLRTYDPPVHFRVIAEAAGMATEAGVINAIRRADAAAAEPESA